MMHFFIGSALGFVVSWGAATLIMRRMRRADRAWVVSTLVCVALSLAAQFAALALSK